MAYENNAFLNKSKNKKSANSPDYWGNITFDEAVVRHLARQIRDGAEPTLRLALWRKENTKGVYLSISASIPQERQEEEGRSPRRAAPRRAPTRNRDDDEYEDERRGASDDDDEAEIPF